jgi:hypothetical protein
MDISSPTVGTRRRWNNMLREQMCSLHRLIEGLLPERELPQHRI